MEKYTIETSGKKITNLSAEDVVKHYQNKVTTELIGSLASTEYPETFADAEEVAQDFGDTVTKVEPTKDNVEEGGKAEFADGDESAQNFNGCPDCDKMLSKASKQDNELWVTFQLRNTSIEALPEALSTLEPITSVDNITVNILDDEKYSKILLQFEPNTNNIIHILTTLTDFDRILQDLDGMNSKWVFPGEKTYKVKNPTKGDMVYSKKGDRDLSYYITDISKDNSGRDIYTLWAPLTQELLSKKFYDTELEFEKRSGVLVAKDILKNGKYKTLSNASKQGTKVQVYFDVKAENYHDMDANLDELLNILESITKREDIVVREEDDVIDNEELTHFTVEFEMYPDAAPDVIVPTLDEFEEALEFFGAEEIGELELNKINLQAKAYTFADWFGEDLTGQTYMGDINCSNSGITSLEGAPQRVDGDFDCYENQLTSLEGAPQRVGGHFDCAKNQLTSLKGAPQRVGKGFFCGENQLTSLEGAPQEVGVDFHCEYNQLTSLEGAPQRIGGGFSCYGNSLTSLEGAPQKVDGGFDCAKNQLTSLEGVSQEVGEDFYCDNNQLTSLEGAPQEINGNFWCRDNQLTSLIGAPQKVSRDFWCNNNQLTSLIGAPQKVGEDFDCKFNQLTSLEGAPQEVGGYFDCDDYLKEEAKEMGYTVKKLNNSKCETSAEKEEVVVIDLDGKVLSWVDENHVDFLDTVDEPDGGKAKAVKFEDEADVKETMERVDISDEEYEILPVSEAFAFVEEGEE